jgi:hypothetical protein
MPYFDYAGKIEAGNLKSKKQAEKFDNPRGYPGLNGLQLKSGSEDRLIEHDREHVMEKEGELVRTAKP